MMSLPQEMITLDAPIAPASSSPTRIAIPRELMNDPRFLEMLQRQIMDDQYNRPDQIVNREGEEIPDDVVDKARQALEEYTDEEDEEEDSEEETLYNFVELPYNTAAIQVDSGMEGISSIARMRYESKISYLIYLTNRKKQELIKMFEEKGDKDLAELIRTGAENSPVLLAIKGLKPEYFEAPVKAREAMKLAGYNHDLNDREVTDLANKAISHKTIVEDGPLQFREDPSFDELAIRRYIDANKGDEIFSYLKPNETKKVLKKLVKPGDSPATASFDPRLTEGLQSYLDIPLR